jgi:hypothetical protein
MAGTRHHILPRFLLKGFASRTQEKKVFTWVYRKGVEPRELSTKDVGVEQHFYGRDGEPNADEEITLLENSQYAPLLERLRIKITPTGVVEVYEPLLANFISHLCTRTKNFRESINQSIDYLITATDSYLSDSSNIKEFLMKHPAQSENYINFKSIILSNPNVLDTQKTELIQFLFSSIKSELPRLIKESHNDALVKIPTSKVRADVYRQMRWFLYTFNKPSVILGDSGCLFEIAGEKNYKIFNDKGEKLRQVFLPIAANKVLIGTISGTTKLDIKKLNRAMAKCSQGFFIYSEFSEGMAKLVPLIGTESEILSQVKLEQIISEYCNHIKLQTL